MEHAFLDIYMYNLLHPDTYAIFLKNWNPINIIVVKKWQITDPPVC